ncbi:hypothetical protein PVK06_016747 [Gossypium arboreum]|uniref:Uncharacterized protein n=1 Tax=Gossypium arboreum TaxID=29729 RepID=A0ABR0Q1J1_GOSAR|nr:hypothetical protein PVK06_016747 [Gossypium arboreum]
MGLILLLVKIIVAVVLVGVTGMFLRLLDALVLTPKRIRSQLQIQATSQSIPPSNNTKFKGKQRKHTDMAENGYVREATRMNNVVFPGRYVCQREYWFPKLVNFKKDDDDGLVRASLLIRWLTCLFLPVPV